MSPARWDPPALLSGNVISIKKFNEREKPKWTPNLFCNRRTSYFKSAGEKQVAVGAWRAGELSAPPAIAAARKIYTTQNIHQYYFNVLSIDLWATAFIFQGALTKNKGTVGRPTSPSVPWERAKHQSKADSKRIADMENPPRAAGTPRALRMARSAYGCREPSVLRSPGAPGVLHVFSLDRFHAPLHSLSRALHKYSSTSIPLEKAK